MPTYQYACTECGHAFEQFQSFSDDALTECPECDGRLRKVFNAVGVVFKGSGFYRTDSRASGSSTSPALASRRRTPSSPSKSPRARPSSTVGVDQSESKPAAAADPRSRLAPRVGPSPSTGPGPVESPARTPPANLLASGHAPRPATACARLARDRYAARCCAAGGLLAALLTAVAVAAGLHAAAAPPPPRRRRAASPPATCPAGAVLGRRRPGRGGVRARARCPPALGARRRRAGRWPRRCGAGEPVTDVRLVGPALADGYPGLDRACRCGCPTPAWPALLRVGDRIDLVAADPQGSGAARGGRRRAGAGAARPRTDATRRGGALPGRLVVVGAPPGRGRPRSRTPRCATS